MSDPVHCERCSYVDGLGLVPSIELEPGADGLRIARPVAAGAGRVAATVAARALFFGVAIWVVLPPIDLAAIARAVGGTYLLMAFWWYFNGPGPRQRWLPAAVFGLANLGIALLVARMLLTTVGLPGR